MDSISEARLGEVYPVLADKVRKMADMLSQEGILIRVVQGLRTVAQQDALYSQKPRVTNAPGGYSYHNFGLAVDCCPSTQGPDQPFDPDWTPSHPSWQRMIAVGISLGLTSGSTWRTLPDAPHFQLTGRFPVGAPTDELRGLLRDQGMEAVWNAVTASLG